MDGAVQVAGLVNGVGIGKKNPAATGLARRGPDGVVLPCPALLELGGVQDGDAGKAASDLGSAVGGVIVDNDQFPVAAEVEDIVRLRDKRLEARTEALLFVTRRNDDSEFDQRLRFWLIEDGAGAG